MIKETNDFELSEFELNQPGIIKLVKLLEYRLAKHRIANDNVDASRLLRGKISELKYLFKKLKLTGDKIAGANNHDLRKP